MEDDNSKENQPSTSKKESQNVSPGSEDEDKNERDKDSRLNNDSYVTTSESSRGLGSIHNSRSAANCRMRLVNARRQGQKLQVPKTERKFPQDKKKEKLSGRVEKRPSGRRRQPNRRVPKRRPKMKHGQDRKKRDASISTIFTRLSSGTAYPNLPCQRCGHRCCRRRYLSERKNRNRKIRKSKPFRQIKKYRRTRRTRLPRLRAISRRGRQESECIQVGSRCLMLSPLCMNSSAGPPEQLGEDHQQHCEITPEMICESLRKLTMWKQEVSTVAILNYLKRCYPVSQDIPALFEELLDKLQVAAIVGIVVHNVLKDSWCLSIALRDRRLTKNHVTLFWNTYADTMRPVTRRACVTSQSTQNRNHTNRSNAATYYTSDENDMV